MSTTASVKLESLVSRASSPDDNWRSMFRLGGAAALVQLVCVISTIVVVGALGAEPRSAQEYYDLLQSNRLVGLLRMDFGTLVLIALFPFTTFGIYAALRQRQPAYAALAGALILIGIVLSLANHSAFSMINLGNLYASATDAARQAQLLAAGEAVVASDMWNTTAGFLAGIFLQGAFVFISFVMLGGKEFRRATAYTGIVANGLDWLHVLIALFLPSLANMLLWIAGPVYLLWFPLLGLDLLRLGRQSTQGKH
jgi:hypothetical protein